MQSFGLNGIKNPNLIFVNQILKIDTTFKAEEASNTTSETRHLVYTIKCGDTLTKIANEFNVSIQSIVTLNDIINPNLIYAGENLRINLLTNNSHNTQNLTQ